MKEEGTKNKLGTMKINKLMLSMGIPMILSMMLSMWEPIERNEE